MEVDLKTIVVLLVAWLSYAAWENKTDVAEIKKILKYVKKDTGALKKDIVTELNEKTRVLKEEIAKLRIELSDNINAMKKEIVELNDNIKVLKEEMRKASEEIETFIANITIQADSQNQQSSWGVEWLIKNLLGWLLKILKDMAFGKQIEG